MDAEVVNKFVISAQGVLETEIGGPVKTGRLSVQTVPYTSQQITTLIGIAGSIQGVMLIGLSEETAKSLVSRMIGHRIAEFNELAQSGIAEMGNVIAGAALTDLSAQGYSCTLSPPNLIICSDTTICTVDIKRLVLPMITSYGPVEIQLALRLSGEARSNAFAKGDIRC